MNKKLLGITIIVFGFIFANSISFAAYNVTPNKVKENNVIMIPELKTSNQNVNNSNRVSKEEFEKRLKLTEAQKKQIIDENRKQDIEKMIPLFKEMKSKQQELKNIDINTTLSFQQKQEKKAALTNELKMLQKKAESYQIENLKRFETVLTDEQRKEYVKMQAEQQKGIEKSSSVPARAF